MSAVPSPRRGLPQPAALANSVNRSAAAPTAASASVVASQASQATRTATYVFRKPANGPTQRVFTTTSATITTNSTGPSTATARMLAYQRSDDVDAGDTNTNPGSNDGAVCFARPTAATFPWSTPPATQSNGAAATSNNFNSNGRALMRPIQSNENGNHCNGGEGPAFVDLSATPEKVRRGRGMAVADDDIDDTARESSGSAPPSQRPTSQSVDPSAGNGTGAQPGDSSLVFALSEDSELKVLASRVGPPAPKVLTRPGPQGSTGPTTTPRHAAAAVGPAAPSTSALHANGAAPVQPLAPRVHRCAPAGDTVVRDGIGPSCTAKPSVRVAHSSPPQQQQPQPQYASSTGTSAGCPSAPPQQQQEPSTVSLRAARMSSGVPLYRSNAHKLPSPPVLHVCPGGIPGTGVVVPPGGNTLGNGNSDGSSNNNPRWSSNGIPSVSLCHVSAAASTATATVTSGAVHHVGGSGSRSAVSSAAPEGSGSVRSCHTKTLSSDARSLHSNTPPPPPHTSQPVNKNFTPAQREAVWLEVQQELFLNYAAVPIPAEMINHGDTDERRRRLEQRQKQIVYGKETEGYAKYTTLVPRLCDREYRNPLHALTPRPEYDCSKRQFDRVLNAWRRQLHQWDDCDLDQLDAKFLPLGTATLRELSLATAPTTPTPTPPPSPPTTLQPSGVMHSIANVAAMAHHHDDGTTADDSGEAPPTDNDGGHGDDEGVGHTRSPVFTGHTPTSAMYSSGLSVHINSGRSSAIAAAACTPSRPHGSEGGEGPQVDEAFFYHMNSGSSRVASPFHPTYSGTNHVASGNASETANAYAYNGGGSGGSGGGTANGRSSTTSYYQQFMRNSNYAHHNGGTPGGSYAAHTGLTPAHRPPSRSSGPHHISAIFSNEYELMTPSGPGSPSGMPHNSRSGGSPYRLGEPWMPCRRSPTYAAQTTAHNANGAAAASTPVAAAAMPSSITAANNTGTMVITGTHGESPPQTTELALIPSTSQSSSGGFAQSPYGFRVHSPVQPQQQPSAVGGAACAPPLSHSQARPGMAGATQLSSSSSRSPIGLPPQQSQSQPQSQPQRVAIATTVAAAARSRRGSGIGAAPTTWTPPNPQAQVRPSPHTPQLHLSATPPPTKRPEAPE